MSTEKERLVKIYDDIDSIFGDVVRYNPLLHGIPEDKINENALNKLVSYMKGFTPEHKHWGVRTVLICTKAFRDEPLIKPVYDELVKILREKSKTGVV